MRARPLLPLLLLAIAMLAPPAGAGEPSGEKTLPPEVAKRIRERIAQLSDDDWAVREEATKALRAIGAPAVPFLEATAKNGDAEAARRAKNILQDIRDAQEAKALGMEFERYRTWSERLAMLRTDEAQKAFDAFLARPGEVAPFLIRRMDDFGAVKVEKLLYRIENIGRSVISIIGPKKVCDCISVLLERSVFGNVKFGAIYNGGTDAERKACIRGWRKWWKENEHLLYVHEETGLWTVDMRAKRVGMSHGAWKALTAEEKEARVDAVCAPIDEAWRKAGIRVEKPGGEMMAFLTKLKNDPYMPKAFGRPEKVSETLKEAVKKGDEIVPILTYGWIRMFSGKYPIDSTVLQTLARIDTPLAWKTLEWLCLDESTHSWTRMMGVELSARFRGKACAGFARKVLETLKDPDGTPYYYSLKAWAKTGDRKAIPFLIGRLEREIFDNAAWKAVVEFLEELAPLRLPEAKTNEQRRETVERWKAWWEANKDKE
jgi:hypothetical protein